LKGCCSGSRWPRPGSARPGADIPSPHSRRLVACVCSVRNWLSSTKPTVSSRGWTIEVSVQYPDYANWREAGSIKAFVRYIENTGSDSERCSIALQSSRPTVRGRAYGRLRRCAVTDSLRDLQLPWIDFANSRV
jgi:hypothetical protein